LSEAGIEKDAARMRERAGRLHRIHQGVYAVGHPLLSRNGRLMAAVLACGPDAVLSHRSAAALWGIRSSTGTRIDVTAPGRRGRSPAGIAAHRHGHLRPQDTTVAEGIACTTVARTLLDLAAVVTPRELANAVTEAEVLRLFDLSAIREVIGRSRGRRGVARLRGAIDHQDPGSARANRGLERSFLALCLKARLPVPAVNALVDLGDLQVVADFAWRERRLVVETDGRQVHGTPRAFERDRARDQRLVLAGWRVLRVTWRQLTVEPERLVATLRALLR
jgi:hypothetical protein